MTNTEIVEETIAFVKETLQGAEGGHDWFHIQPVFKTSLLIAKDEKNINILVISLGALLHDIADAKFHNGDETVGPKLADTFLNSMQVNADVIAQVIQIIENISFKKSLEKNL